MPVVPFTLVPFTARETRCRQDPLQSSAATVPQARCSAGPRRPLPPFCLGADARCPQLSARPRRPSRQNRRAVRTVPGARGDNQSALLFLLQPGPSGDLITIPTHTCPLLSLEPVAAAGRGGVGMPHAVVPREHRGATTEGTQGTRERHLWGAQSWSWGCEQARDGV